MTRAVRDRILKDANGNISDHLRNHIHLTNCIHLKNHMHKHSPILADRSLMRDLVVLQRSRSLRDPSASPPLAVDMFTRRVENGRRSLDGRRLLPENSPPLVAAPPRRSSVSRSGIREQQKRIEQAQQRRGDNIRSLSEQLDEIEIETETTPEEDADDVASRSRFQGFDDRAGQRIRSSNRVKSRRFRGARRTRAAVSSREEAARNEMSVASNSHPVYHIDEQEEEEEEERGVEQEYGDRNRCGIPFNWSRIHHRGKSILDLAGKSLSCGRSDSRSKESGKIVQGRCFQEILATSENSDSKSEAEAMPLLVGGSRGSTDNAGSMHDYSGELGIFADSLLRRETDSDLVSEARNGHRRHLSITQKYAPRTFRDLVGQNLVANALSNAVAKRKIGLLYVFYGPHGTGKTSSAQIFARSLNCQSSDRPKPCGVCISCVSHNNGRSRYIKEVGPVSNFDFETILDLLENMTVTRVSSQYRVFIFDDCDGLSPDCWSAISKVIDRVPRRVVFILVSSSLDVLPHMIISRCQKFFFPKLKDADIISTLQWISSKEGLVIDRDALKLIASRSDGSLRDAEMTLEQLSLLGQRISVSLVQELVGLISDEKLVDLLDLALSADTVNTVKNLREIMESGVEPLALMSQLATVITDILAGSYDFMKERPRRKFFRRQTLSKEDMEKLRQALKTLSEAEKQLRVSNDRLTWLTAALLQLAPDQQYLLPSSSAETSFNHSPTMGLTGGGRERSSKSNADTDTRALSMNIRRENRDKNRPSTSRQLTGNAQRIDEIWQEVLEKIQEHNIKEFMYREGKLVSVTFGAAPTVQLIFSSHLAKSKAEKFLMHIIPAFESVLGSAVTIEIRCESRKDGNGKRKSEIIEIESSPRGGKNGIHHIDRNMQSENRILAENSKNNNVNQSQSLVRSKVSLAHVIQQAEGHTQRSGWSKQKAVSIAEKLEQENLRLEPRSRTLLCWKASRVTRRKLSRLKIRSRRPKVLLKYISCGKCLSTKSPR